jgi:PAS domain S-box-containing protein
MNEPAGIMQTIKARILVVDDEKRIRDACHQMLSQEGFSVAMAESGELGLKMIEQEHFDLILLDLMMPGLSGLETLPKLKALHPDTVVVVITGYATLEHAVEAMKEGAFDFIPKPFSPDELRLVVTKALEFTRTLRDITNEKSRMRVLINHLSDGVMATDSEKNIALANPAFLRMVGYQGEDVVGRSVDTLIKNREFIAIIDQALSMPHDEFIELSEEFDNGSLAKDKDTVLTVRCVPFRGRLPQNLGSVSVMHDITTLKMMDRLKSDFVSMVAHEIRSPINSILMQLKVLLNGRAGEIEPKQKEILDRVTERLNALVNLSTELLDLAKIESGLMNQEKERIDLAVLLADQVEFRQAEARTKKQTLRFDVLAESSLVLGNRQSMEELISNLLANAINYTPQGGEISVSVYDENNYLHIEVRDTGMGIAEDDLERIFDRFYRVKDEKTRYITGTGLGLPIVKSIVEAHNGMIRVESVVDKGTTFHVLIPLLLS